LRKSGAALVAGGAFAALAVLSDGLNVFIRAALASGAYLGCLWLTGAFEVTQLRALLGSLRRA
jgi:hypothetical protein